MKKIRILEEEIGVLDSKAALVGLFVMEVEERRNKFSELWKKIERKIEYPETKIYTEMGY